MSLFFADTGTAVIASISNSGNLPKAAENYCVTICHILFMCGRYRLSRRKKIVEEYFDTPGDEDWSPRYNIAPTQPVPIIRQNPKEPRRELSLVRWGLIPPFSKNPTGPVMINARSECKRFRSRLRACSILHTPHANVVSLAVVTRIGVAEPNYRLNICGARNKTGIENSHFTIIALGSACPQTAIRWDPAARCRVRGVT